MAPHGEGSDAWSGRPGPPGSTRPGTGGRRSRRAPTSTAPVATPPRLVRAERQTRLIATVCTSVALLTGLVATFFRDNRLDAFVRDRRADSFEVLDPANAVIDLANAPLLAIGAAALAARVIWWRWRWPPTAVLPFAVPGAAVALADVVLKPLSDALGGRGSWPSGTVAFVVAGSALATVLFDAHAPPNRRHVVGPALVTVAVLASLLATAEHRFTELLGGAAIGLGLAASASLTHDTITREALRRRSRPGSDGGTAG